MTLLARFVDVRVASAGAAATSGGAGTWGTSSARRLPEQANARENVTRTAATVRLRM
jgi:hypothetical protein